MIMYKLISKKYCIENTSYIGYGIAMVDETVRIEDISTEKCKVEKLIGSCNDFDVSPIHLNDIVIDFLNKI